MEVLPLTLLLLVALVPASSCSIAADSEYEYNITETIEPTIQCPPGYVAHQNQCLKYILRQETAPDELRCPAGLRLTNAGVCVISDTHETIVPTQTSIKQSPTCPHGYTFNGLDCHKSEPICPAGYSYVPSDGQCWATRNYTTVGPSIHTGTTYQPCGYSSTPCPAPVPAPVPCPYATPHYQPCSDPPRPPPPPPHPINEVIKVPPTFTRSVVPPFQPPTYPTCPTGWRLENSQCVQTSVKNVTTDPIRVCPAGYYRAANNQCVKDVTKVIEATPTYVCPTGFNMVNNICTRFRVDKGGYVGGKEKETVVSPPATVTEKEHHIFVNNTIYAPVNINNVNNHTIVVPMGHTRDSYIEKKVVHEKEVEVEEEEKCCEVISPRICRKMPQNNWKCFHKRTQQCGSCCTAPKIYLKPPMPVYRPQLMVVPPAPQPIFVQEPSYSHDCSQCHHGEGYCPGYCNTYDCATSGSGCEYANQETYCSSVGGRACARDFGCMGQSYCS